MTLREDIPLAPLTTFRMGPVARYLIEVGDSAELPEAFSFIRERGLPFFVLGGGSNVIFTEPAQLNAVILKITIPGFEVEDQGDHALVRIGAGEDWDSVVARAVERGLSGIEAMSAIPGLAGATPIQNVGAYGTEIADVLEYVDVFEHETGEFLRLPKEACGFSYRNSRFKHETNFVIAGITLRLSRAEPKVPQYPGVQAYLEEHGITTPTLRDIRDSIIAIRKTKLPDPKDVPSVGSFFKNPFVSSDVVDRLRADFENPVVFDAGGGRYKVGAGWLIDTLGLKGKSFGNLALYPHNALVVTNSGGATYAELTALMSDLKEQVRTRFGIDLEPEPTFI